MAHVEDQQQQQSSIERLLQLWPLEALKAVQHKLSVCTSIEDLFDPHAAGGPTHLCSESALRCISHWKETILTSGFTFSAKPNMPSNSVEESRLYQRCLVMTDLPFYAMTELLRLFNLFSPKVAAIQQVKLFLQSSNSFGYFVLSKKESENPSSSSNGSLHVCYRSYSDPISTPKVADFGFTRSTASSPVTDEYLLVLEQVLRAYCPLLNEFTLRACKARMQRVFCPEYRYHTFYPKCATFPTASSEWLEQIEPLQRDALLASFPNVSDHNVYMNCVVTYIQRISYMNSFDVTDLLPAAVVDMDHLIFLAPIRSVCVMSFLGMQFLPLTLKNYRTKFFRYESNDMDKNAIAKSLLEKLTRRMTCYMDRFRTLYAVEDLCDSTSAMDNNTVPCLRDPALQTPAPLPSIAMSQGGGEEENCNFLADD